MRSAIGALIVFAPFALLAQRPPASMRPAADSVRVATMPSVLIGRVVDSAGAGIARAEITLNTQTHPTAVTTDSGEFRITGLRPGANIFGVRRLGFSAATFTAMLKPGRTHRTTFELSAAAQALPVVAVNDSAVTSHWLDQFNRRRSTMQGTFITRAEIVKSGARRGSDILRSVAGVHVVSSGIGPSDVRIDRGGGARTCRPTMYVHTQPYGGTLDDFPAEDIEAIELYKGVSEIPVELDRNGRGYCAMIVVWTRDPTKSP